MNLELFKRSATGLPTWALLTALMTLALGGIIGPTIPIFTSAGMLVILAAVEFGVRARNAGQWPDGRRYMALAIGTVVATASAVVASMLLTA